MDELERLGLGPEQGQRAVPKRQTIADVFAHGIEVGEVVVADVLPGVDLAPSSRELRDVELGLVSERKREYFLRRALAPVAGSYDVVLIDCPPNRTSDCSP